MATPLWLTPERKEQLVDLAIQYKLRRVCLKGHPSCPLETHYKRVVVRGKPVWKRTLAVTAINRRIVDLHENDNIAKRSPDEIRTGTGFNTVITHIKPMAANLFQFGKCFPLEVVGKGIRSNPFQIREGAIQVIQYLQYIVRRAHQRIAVS